MSREPVQVHTVARQQGDDDKESALFLAAVSRHFTGLVIDEIPVLLEESYRLRYQVYCVERRFLRAEDYPDQMESDEFDRHSVHLGVVNAEGELVATARLVESQDQRLPLFDHCNVFPNQPQLRDSERRVVEISRLSVSRRYNRRIGDGFYSQQAAASGHHHPERRGGGAIVFAIYKAIYQVSKRRGFTHWVMAAEKSLRRLVGRYGFPFRAFGPESDYYGLVQPYLLDLGEFDEVILSGRIPPLNEFLVGLEPEFRPAGSGAQTTDGAVHEST